MIYFIQAGENGPIKIGKSDDPERRLKDLQTAHYEELELLHVWDHEDDGEWDEPKIHAHLSEYRRHGEWFNPHENVFKFINDNMYEYGSVNLGEYNLESDVRFDGQFYFNISDIDYYIQANYSHGKLSICQTPEFNIEIDFKNDEVIVTGWDADLREPTTLAHYTQK